MSKRGDTWILILAGLAGLTAQWFIMQKIIIGRSMTTNSVYTRHIGVLVTDKALKRAESDIGITMPCGHVFKLRKGDPFPADNIPCPCGDTNHWLFQRK